MEFVMRSDRWFWSERPFPAYRCSLDGGKTVVALHVKDVRPVTILHVYGGHLLYAGTDFSKAKRVRDLYDAEQSVQGGSHGEIEVGRPTLPDGDFKVITAKKKGTHIVVPGKDETKRCLLFVGYRNENNWSVSLSDRTTGTVLEQCKSDNALEVSVLLNVNQAVVFEANDGLNQYRDLYGYIWNGHEIQSSYRRVKGGPDRFDR